MIPRRALLVVVAATLPAVANRKEEALMNQVQALGARVAELSQVSSETLGMLRDDIQVQTGTLQDEQLRMRNIQAELDATLASAEKTAQAIADAAAQRERERAEERIRGQQFTAPVRQPRPDEAASQVPEPPTAPADTTPRDTLPRRRLETDHRTAQAPPPRSEAAPVDQIASPPPVNERETTAPPPSRAEPNRAEPTRREVALAAPTPRPTPARSDAATLLERDPAPDLLYRAATGSYLRSDFDDAIARFTELINKYPQHPKALESLYWRAECFRRRERCSDAVADLEQFIGKAQNHSLLPGALDRCARCLEQLGKHAQAQALRERLLAEHPDSTEARRLKRMSLTP